MGENEIWEQWLVSDIATFINKGVSSAYAYIRIENFSLTWLKQEKFFQMEKKARKSWTDEVYTTNFTTIVRKICLNLFKSRK